MSIIFWIVVLIDAAVLGLFFLLGLAAAPSSKTSPLAVAAFMLGIPAILLTASILLFLLGKSTVLRGLAFLLVASPILFVVAQTVLLKTELRQNTDSKGTLTFFREGPLREIAAAITANDATTIQRLAPQVNLNTHGFDGMTPLVAAFRQIRQTPARLEVLRALIQAGADPNEGTEYEIPLQMAIQQSAATGPEPVALLLAAKANPNRKDSMGTPIFFGASGIGTHPDVLKLVLDRGSDVNLDGRSGETVLFYSTSSRNWKGVLLLLDRGADWRKGKAFDGLPFKATIEKYAAEHPEDSAVKPIAEFLRQHGA